MGKVQKIHYFDGIEKGSFFLFIVLGLALGFSTGYMLVSQKVLMPILLSLLMGVFAYKKDKRYLFIFAISFLSFFILGIMHNFIESMMGFQTINCIVVKTKDNYFIVSNGWHKYYVYEKNNTRQIGDILRIEGYISQYEGAEYESRFSFKEYLFYSGIKYSLKVSHSNDLFRFSLRLREKELRFLSNFDTNVSALLDSLLFGRKDYSNELIVNASYLGCLNFLSNSGLFFSGLLKGLEKILSYKFDLKKQNAITYAVALMLLPFFIGKVGVYRVIIMRSIDLFYVSKNNVKENYLSKLNLSAMTILLLNPFNSISSGFLVGFGLCYYMHFLTQYLRKYKKIQRRIVSFCLLNLFLIPLFNVNGELKILAPFFALIFPFISYPFVLFGYLSFVTLPFIRLLNAFGSMVGNLIDILEKVDLSLPIGAFPDYSIYLYYLCVFLVIYLKDTGLTNIERWFKLLAFFSLSIPSLPMTTSFTQEVSFINVGQGDSILIRDGFTSVLIDTGGSLSFDIAQEVDLPFLRKEKVYSLDALIITHGDYDHDGGKESLMKNFSVKKIVDSKGDFPLKVGNLTFLNYNVYEKEESNEQSLVLWTKIMGKSFLFMGDATTNIEKAIIKDNPNLKADIIKIGHHGSKTSSSMEFLKQIQPKVAVISVGKNNKYGHPDDEVMKRLKQLKIKIKRTDLEGTIIYKSYFHMPLGEL